MRASTEGRRTTASAQPGGLGLGTITAKHLAAIMPRCPADKAETYARHLTAACIEAQINTLTRVAAFIGQWALESNEFRSWEEDLNYDASGLLRAWPHRFTDALALQMANKPELIANHAYANRLGNGPPESGDGWRYRGRGPPQLTGKDNYIAAGAALGIDLVNHPEIAAQPEHGFRIAAWYWTTRKINAMADALGLEAITRAINGGLTHHDRRVAYTQKALLVLGRDIVIMQASAS